MLLKNAIELVFDTIVSELARAGRVELREFGTFSVRKRDAKIARNPRSGDKIAVPPKQVAYFRPSRVLSEHLNAPVAGADNVVMLKR